MPLIKKLAIVLSIILVYLAIFYPAFQGNIIPKTLDIEERNLALYAIEETESQLDIQGDGILQYEVVSFKRPVEHIVVHNNFPGSNNVWQETCDVEIKMKTRTFFGQPFYEIIVYLNSTENFNYNYCDLEIPNECDFDPNCKP
ncbi:MAG: hypothetical protein Q7K34_01615 [archaeon]|nr:hypothetical protein [archaeon]